MRVELDERVDLSFGRRSVDWELKGVPVRLEVGPRDVAEGVVTVVRRDVGTKQAMPVGSAAREASALLEVIQADMLAAATAERDARIREVATVEEAVEASSDGWGVMPWAVLQAADGEIPPARARDHRALPGRRRRRPALGRGRPRRPRLRRPRVLTLPTPAVPALGRPGTEARRNAGQQPPGPGASGQ